MSTPVAVSRTTASFARPTLRKITIAALVLNALLCVWEIANGAPQDIYLPHVIVSLVIAVVVALRWRWTPALGALLLGLQIIEGVIFLQDMLTNPSSVSDFIFAASFFVISILGFVAGIGATIQNYRAPRTRPFVDPPAPSWIYPVMLASAVLLLGAIATTAIQTRGSASSVTPAAMAAMPVLQARDYEFAQTELKAKVGEIVMLRLDNADSSIHYLDIDELDIHAQMPVGKSNVAIFRATQPGTYTFYCHPHADKDARAGMVGTLVVTQ